ncbi:DNA-binding protein [Chitinophaga agrisoli]|uniref:DNA-binding protein n=2 Tax=Chitinophaga agrisoli TaxID=2607653 RepID=A0A5B2VZY2_9BACT|nr:DNA-binding protein [Chitinophaga agrisoli]
MLVCLSANAQEQEYVSPVKPPLTGRSPGVKVKLISDNGTTKTYAVIFAAGDEVLSGLKEFAIKYKVQSAHFTAIGDAISSKYGWYDKSRQMFKVFKIDNFAEITSLVGDIALYNGTPVVHGHVNFGTEDGTVRGGHLLEAVVSPTLEAIVTVEPEALYKKLSPEFGISVIDTDLKK